MNKKTWICLVALLSLYRAHSQKFPNYGQVSTAELNMKQCIFDKNADAVVLLDEAVSDYNDIKEFYKKMFDLLEEQIVLKIK